MRIHDYSIMVLLAACAASQAAGAAPAQWETEIRAFEARDRLRPPPTNAVLFIGSSSIRLWTTLAKDMQGLPVINRGFGGSQMSDSVHYADRIVLPYQPREVVVYAGDNDLAAGKTPEQVRDDFAAFVAKVRQALPETHISYIAIKPSPSRWRLADQMRAANNLIAQFTTSDPRLHFIDVFTPMLNNEGQPRAELFLPDKLHLNPIGYDLWTTIIRSRLEERKPREPSPGTRPAPRAYPPRAQR